MSTGSPRLWGRDREVGRIEGMPRSAPLGGSAAGDRDRFLVGQAVLTLLAGLADRGGLVCLLDDGQWMDRASMAAVSFAARRPEAERLALILASRDDPPGELGFPVLRLPGLDHTASGAWLDAHAALLAAGPAEPVRADG